jgi:oxygen-independent coproporphyrinogen-3 oxidase
MKRAGLSSGRCSRTTEHRGLYIHVPFCLRKCHYCSFVSRAADIHLHNRWFDALLSEARAILDTGVQIGTIYAGGGTPSLIAPDRWTAFMLMLKKNADLTSLRESTIEVNPATCCAEDIAGFREAGFDRISIGIQSLGKRELALLGRIHSAEQAEETIGHARDAAFDSIGIDLIYGIPGQTVEGWEENLRRASLFQSDHISCYELTLDTGTPIGALCSEGKLEKPDDNTCAEMYTAADRILTDVGYEHYEVSSYALGRENRSKHNSGYWNRTPYSGLGPSAHSFDGIDQRWWNTPDLIHYMELLENGKSSREGFETLSREQQAEEVIMLGMRCSDGFDREKLRRLGFFLSDEGETLLNRLSSEGQLTRDETWIRPSASGMLLADGIALGLCQHLEFESPD